MLPVSQTNGKHNKNHHSDVTAKCALDYTLDDWPDLAKEVPEGSA